MRVSKVESLARPFRLPRMTRRHTAIDLFSGCGGLTLGLKLAGFTVVAAIENDHLAVDTYKVNHPGVHICHADIRTVTAKRLREQLNLRVGELDLLAGCPPSDHASRHLFL